ncbi:MAG: hypothetical protein ABIO72_03595 [Patescibacteria group bacterium]
MKRLVFGGLFSLIGAVLFVVGLSFALWMWLNEQSMIGIFVLVALWLIFDDLAKKYDPTKAE